MLQHLHIQNLALVTELDIEFETGLNTVTGETGAGKSLILGALQLLLGERAGASVIRRDAKQCEISATVAFPNGYAPLSKHIDVLLEEGAVSGCEDGQLLLRRVVTPSGSRSYVNGSAVTQQFLRQLGELLVDIHGPHEHQSLLRPREQLGVLDAYAGLTDTVDRCTEAFRARQEREDELSRIRTEQIDSHEIELVGHQLREIEAADLNLDEDESLAERYEVVANGRELLRLASQCRAGLTESDGAITEQLSTVLRLLQDIERCDAEHGAQFTARLEEAVNLLQDLSFELADYADSLELDEQELLRLEERLDLLQKLKRKHGPTLENVLEAADEFRERLAAVEGREERIAALAATCRGLAARHAELCAALGTKRAEAAEALAKAIETKLQRLGFAQSHFEIRIAESDPGPSGSDRIEFCFAPNPGEDAKPLRQIASSGEMARVMLAVKTVLSSADNVPILVFDEVDANIGGRTAVVVAEELSAIASRHQVLCITHLPQIAAAGQLHFQVRKRIEDNRTITEMAALTGREREQELARMLGAAENSSIAAAHAQEMLMTAGKAGEER